MKRHSVLPVLLMLVLSPTCVKKESDKEQPAAAKAAPAPTLAEDGKSVPAPSDVAAPPAGAQVTESGLASAVLSPGSGTAKPAPGDRVKVHYTGWTKDGKMFDSSLPRQRPAEFGVKQVIPGWTEGLQLMVEGEKRRFWIPGKLAYGDTPKRAGAPAGQLTFDVELIEIIEQPKPPETPKDVAAPPPEATKTESGLAFVVLEKGEGSETPRAHDRVKVHYTGWTKDGKMFDSSVPRGRPATFSLSQVVAGWTEGLQLMVQGEKRRFWIPAELAYGEETQHGKPSGQLTFEVELLEIERMPEPPPVPADVAAPPKDAVRTASGLATKLLTKGNGAVKPKPENTVEVHYTGWTTDGKMFDSSVTRGRPARFGLRNVIPGWTEGVQLMVEGEKRRFWIPGKLAYGDKPQRPGTPSGMLVFDIELIKIHETPAGRGRKTQTSKPAAPKPAPATQRGASAAKPTPATKPTPANKAE